MLKFNTIIKYLVLLTLTIIVTLFDNNLAVLPIYLGYFLFGQLLIFLFFSRENRRVSLQVFFILFIVYFLFTYITNEVFVTDPYRDYFVARDSLQFFGEIDLMLKSNTSLFSCYKIIHETFHYSDYPAFSYICVTIGYVANFIGHNSLLVQKLQIVFLAAFIPTFIYNIAIKYWSTNKAVKCSLLYGFCSWIFFYSAVFLRDMDVCFIYAFAFFLFFKKISLNNFIILCILSLIAGNFRPENGLFFLAFIGMYLYLYYRESKRSIEQAFFIFLFLMGVVGFLFLSGIIAQAFETLTKTTTTYQDLSLSDANRDGIGIILLKLPFGLRNIARSIYSQMAPFPFYLSYSMFEDSIWSTPAAIASLFWFGLWSGIVFGLFNKDIRRQLDKRIVMIFIIGLLLILAASAGASDVRRIMCVYPAIYFMGYFCFSAMYRKTRRMVIFRASFVYFGLMILYLVLKIK